ncbi:hypothetical protein ACFLS1_01035 [Verrucomicrobiota bacterium]
MFCNGGTVLLNIQGQTSGIDDERKKKARLKIGLILIAISYIFWGAMFAFGALAINNIKSPWSYAALAAFILSWIIFIPGIMMTGVGAFPLIRLGFRQLLKRKKNTHNKMQ